ncbi:MAG TPA: DUF4118 domain-containing protein, partial [Acidobacteriota bacterium]|nr:DUF4118 domain-containing protein [Acidobacteriota bacterium]
QTHANATTASLAYMVLVLLTSLISGLGPGIFASVSSTLCLNYYFLPPIGTFVIDRTEDWIALTAFLLSAVLVSQLSSAVKKRAVEAERARDELAGLYKLSHTLMSTPASSLEASTLAKVILEAFGLEYCSYHTSSGEKLDTLVDEHARGVRYVSVRAGEKLMGVLTIKPDRLASNTLNAIAGLLALALDQPS